MLRKMFSAVAVLVSSLVAVQASAVPLVPAMIIRPVDATFSVANYGTAVPTRAIDNSGLRDIMAQPTTLNTGDAVPVVYPAHNNVGHPGDATLSNNTQNLSMYFDLGAVYNLNQTASMHVWNYTETGGGHGRGVQNLSIYYTSTGTNIGNASGWTLAANNVTFSPSDDTNTYTGLDYTYLNNLSARFVRFDVTSNWSATLGGGNYTGLSEIRFISAEVPQVPAPEPASLALLGLGCVGLMAYRRRRSR